MAIATLGGLIATGVAALPAQADRIATEGHTGAASTQPTRRGYPPSWLRLPPPGIGSARSPA